MVVYDHTAILPVEYVEAFSKFIEQTNLLMDRLDEILIELDDWRHYALDIALLDLLDFNQQLGTLLIHKPTLILPLFAEAIQQVAERRIQVSEDRYSMCIKKYIHPRLVVPPLCESVCKVNVSSIRSSDVGGVVSIRGTVVRAGTIKMLESEREYMCAKCQFKFKVYANLEHQNGNLVPPTACPSAGAKPCKSTTFNIVEGSRVCRDYQEIKIQEEVQKLSIGSIPRSIVVVLEDDLVDRCKPGDDVVITAIPTRRWKSLVKDVRPDIEMVLTANNIKVCNEEKARMNFSEEMSKQFESFWSSQSNRPLFARDHIIRSFCPMICGLYKVKLSLLLALIGGVPRSDTAGTRTRGESHCLIIGDPGLGKSQLLKYCAKLSPRAVHTTGIGTTSAGLTVTAQRDSGGEWVLEAGALVLADGGVCCIDEFDCIRESDRTAIHEAMEQQTISVAKAGLVCKLNTRCTVIAATNPRGKFDPDESATNEEWDRKVSSHILNGQSSTPGEESPLGRLWDFEKLQMYICWVKRSFKPHLTETSEKILVQYYKIQRGEGGRNAARTTVRMLESLVRLAQAHARLMMHTEVTEQDAIMAVSLLDSTSTLTDSATNCSNRMHAPFPDDPDAEYEIGERRAMWGE
ncbi:minichromosome maintenance protein 9 [Guillardia theta CCMP2712]|uniref:DNA helicase n=1 Tax=Guillardia theta (strain CCMP2712) TaxID=905079 RepID=L1JGU1_GUITC|nr:minichromosome maintenance protein 9 [Guillardia theta CCMP2712]EKX47552.1 minichromosome maintenance protein 9 [Guillardia theta CCMP2712]|eukprot:XP_005834532.1 minichromosome maintenance protein 9 [Guillardia theta CCMP2712]